MYKTLFIIGNGFDLDLNLKTSYHDFLDSSYFRNKASIFSEYELKRLNGDINIFSYIFDTILCYIKDWILLQS